MREVARPAEPGDLPYRRLTTRLVRRILPNQPAWHHVPAAQGFFHLPVILGEVLGVMPLSCRRAFVVMGVDMSGVLLEEAARLEELSST